MDSASANVWRFHRWLISATLRRIAWTIRDIPGSWVVVGDWRHFFHQFPLSEEVSRFFGVVSAKGKGYRWCTLPMGHSHSPYVAQCFGWVILLTRNDNQEELFEAEEVERVRAQYVSLKGGGCATLYYDNFLVVGPSAKKMFERIKKNCGPGCLNIAIKELECLSSLEMLTKGCDFLGTHLQTIIQAGIPVLKITQAAERLANWRTIASSRSLEAWKDSVLQMAARDVASIIGKVLWRITLAFTPLAECQEVIDILRRLPRLDWDMMVD